MSAASDLSSQPLSADASQGIFSGVQKITAVGVTLVTFPIGNSGYTGYAIRNNNATQWVRVNFTLAGAAATEMQVIIRPGNTASATFDSDAIIGMSVEVIVTPGVGLTTAATATTAIGVVGSVDIDFQLINQ